MPENFNVKRFLALWARNCISLKMSILMSRRRWKCFGQRYGANATNKRHSITFTLKHIVHIMEINLHIYSLYYSGFGERLSL